MNITDELAGLTEKLVEYDAHMKNGNQPPSEITSGLIARMMNVAALVNNETGEIPGSTLVALPEYYKRLMLGAFIEALANNKGFSIPWDKIPKKAP